MNQKIRILASLSLSRKSFYFKPLYSGGTLWTDKRGPAVVLDINGLENVPQKAKVCFDHDEEIVVGTMKPEIVEKDGKLEIHAVGTLDDSPEATRILQKAKENGVRWECSIATQRYDLLRDAEIVPPQKTVEVNGRKFIGPLQIVRRWSLCEGSFVKRGADAWNHVTIQAHAIQPKEMKMSEELRLFISEAGYDPDSLTPDQMAIFEKAYARHVEILSENLDAGEMDEITEAEGEETSSTEEEKTEAEETQPVEKQEDNATDETEAEGEETEEKNVSAKTKASRKVNRTARRMGTGKVTASQGAPNPMDVYSVAMMRNLGFFTDSQIKASGFSDNAMTEGLAKKFNGFSVKQLAIEMLRHATGNIYQGNEDAFVEAFFYPQKVKASAFSTQNPLAILSNVLNKSYYQGSQRLTSIVDKIAHKILLDRLDDAKITSYDIYGLPPDQAEDGVLTNATIKGEDYDVGIGRSGNILTLTRDMLINNDIEGFVNIVMKLGIKHQRKREKRGIGKFLDSLESTNKTFTHGNKIAAPLSLTGLDAAAAALATMEAQGSDPKDPEYTELEGKYLLVPPALAATAYYLFQDTNITMDSGDRAMAFKNTYHQFTPLVSPYLGSGAHTNGSNTGWFLLADPGEAAILAETRLRGAQEPHITPVPTPSNIIDASWATFFEYGFGIMDHRAAVYSSGTEA